MKSFEIVTDHSALKWLQTCKIPKGRRARWIMELQQYNFTIRHRPEKTNANADALSRINEEPIECFMITLEEDTEEQILDRPLICLTCGRRSGGDIWNQGHPYSRTRGTYICRYLDDDPIADIRPALTREEFQQIMEDENSTSNDKIQLSLEEDPSEWTDSSDDGDL